MSVNTWTIIFVGFLYLTRIIPTLSAAVALLVEIPEHY
jgi:hypothetical protein